MFEIASRNVHVAAGDNAGLFAGWVWRTDEHFKSTGAFMNARATFTATDGGPINLRMDLHRLQIYNEAMRHMSEGQK